MKNISFTYTPRLVTTFTKKEVEIMMLCSKHHYDVVCRMASSQLVQGKIGFLRGIKNTLDNCGEEHEVTLDFRELDTLAKILEVSSMMNSFSLIDSNNEIVRNLRKMIHNSLTALNNAAIPDKAV